MCGFTLFSHRVAAMLGFDDHRAIGWPSKTNLTTEVESPILAAAAKRDALNDLRGRFALEVGRYTPPR